MRWLALVVAAAIFVCAGGDAGARSSAWSAPAAIVPNVSEAFDYAVGMSARGDAVAAWIDSRGVHVSTAAAGHPFGAPQRLAALARPILGRLLVVDRRGDAMVAWTVANAPSSSGLYASYRPAGGSFEAPQRISHAGVRADFGLDASGDATFVWEQFRGNRRPATVNVVERMAGGTVRRVQALETSISGGSPSVAVNTRDDAVIAWVSGSRPDAAVHCATRRRGHRFGPPFALSPAAGAENTSVGIDDSGRAFVAWDGPYTGAAVGFPYATVNTATVEVGARAGGQVQLLDVAHAGNLVESGPDVRMDSRGDVLMVWERYGNSPSGPARIEVARGRVGRDLKVTATLPSDLATQSVASAIGPGGDAVIAWSNLSRPDEATVTPVAGPALSAVAAISPQGRDADVPAVALDSRGDAIALWWDMGPSKPGTSGSDRMPLLYATAKLH
jgi:hypothetical protein